VPVFYSLQDTKTPVKIGIVAVVINLVLNLLLISSMQHRGLALATSLSAMFNFSLLFLILRRRIGGVDGKRIVISHFKVVLSSLGMIPFSIWLNAQSFWETSGAWAIKSAVLAAAIFGSALVYFFIQALLKGEELSFIASIIKDRFSRISKPHLP
jgi:putative peptidoglycan lipid II flippase